MAEKIDFQIIKNTDYEFLYDLLLQRNPDANISHKKMPTYEEHVNFVKSSPYSKWYIIEVDEERAGSIYLTKQNEIGIHFFKKYEESERYQHVVKKLMLECPEEKFFININILIPIHDKTNVIVDKRNIIALFIPCVTG